MSILDKYSVSLESYPHGMNRNEFIKEYKKFLHETKLHAADCPIGAGGSCLMFGLRDRTGDIDMSVPQQFFDKCKHSGKYKVNIFHIDTTGEDVEVIPYNDVVDLHIPDGKETVMIDGVCTWSPAEVYKFKTMMNREKDQKDIAALEKKFGFKR